MDRTLEIIDELEVLATSIYHVRSVLILFNFYFQNKIIFLGHPPVCLGKSPPKKNSTMLSLYSLENIKYVLFTT
jgi:hypothetical protein